MPSMYKWQESHALYVAPGAQLGRLSIKDDDRPRGIAIHAGSGSGKSAMIGGVVCLQDLCRGIPQLVLDPQGPVIDHLLLRILHLPRREARRHLARILYVDMSGRGDQIVPFPLLYRLGGENLRDVADRFLETLRKINPQLESAAIQGFNSILHVGRPTLMILAALRRPITDALSLLRQPELHGTWLDQAVAADSTATPAVAFFRDEYMPMRPPDRLALARSFMVKLEPFELDPGLSAMFATSAPGIDLAEVADKRLTVLLDFRDETNAERRRFKMRWVFEWFQAYVRRRGTGEKLGFGFVIDELAELTNQAAAEHDPLAKDLDELVNILARNRGLYLTLAHQEMFQLPASTQKTLLTCGTQILGTTADIESAKYLAEQFFSLDPYRIKRMENVWGSDQFGPQILEERQVDLPLEEQIRLGAQVLLDLQPFELLVKVRSNRHLTRISTRSLLGELWPSDYQEELATLRIGLQKQMPAETASHAVQNVLPQSDSPIDILSGSQPYETVTTCDQVESDYWDTGALPPPGISAPGS